MNVEIEGIEKNKEILRTSDLRVGDVGISSGPERYLILRTYDNLVNLKNPNDTWARDANLSLEKILPKGTRIVLTIE